MMTCNHAIAYQADSFKRKYSCPKELYHISGYQAGTEGREKKKAYPISKEKSFGLKSLTSAIPRCAIIENSLPKMYNNPTKMKASATSAVELNLAKLRTRASGKKIINCTKMKYWMGSSVTQFVTPKTKA